MAQIVDGFPPGMVSPSRIRENGLLMRKTVIWKMGKIRLKDGTMGFGEVWRKVLKEESIMLSPQKKIEGPAAVVAIGRGLTLSIGDYQFARMDEFISMPVNAKPEDVETLRLDLRKEVEGHIEAERIRIQGTMAEKVAYVKAGLLKLTDFGDEEKAQIEAHLKPS